MPDGFHARTAVWEDLFEDDAAAIQPDVRRLDEARRYLEAQICQRPEIGDPAGFPGVFRVPFKLPRADGKLVTASVFYIYDEDHVYFLSIKLAPPSYWSQPEDPS